MPRTTKPNAANTNQKQTGKKPSPKSDDVVWGGFINIKITDDTKSRFEVWLARADTNVWQEIEDTLAHGIKFSLSWDSENECFISAFIGAGVVGSNERYCLTARAGTMAEAAALLVFKDLIICSHDWGQYKPSTGTVNNWG